MKLGSILALIISNTLVEVVCAKPVSGARDQPSRDYFYESLTRGGQGKCAWYLTPEENERYKMEPCKDFCLQEHGEEAYGVRD
jgi:hypothetical protein